MKITCPNCHHEITKTATKWPFVIIIFIVLIYSVFHIYNSRLENQQKLQREIYQRSLPYLEAGQSLEIKTGTHGKQQEWAAKVAEVQASGGLKSIEAATQLMFSMNYNFSGHGGIKNPKIFELTKQFAPFFGATQMSAEGISATFDLARTAKIPLSKAAYELYFSKLLAGYQSVP